MSRMSSLRNGLLGLMLVVLTGSVAEAAVIIIHGPHDAPPGPREEHTTFLAGDTSGRGGHWEWRRHRRYAWSRGHYVRERPGYEYAPGYWDRHQDHYDWHEG